MMTSVFNKKYILKSTLSFCLVPALILTAALFPAKAEKASAEISEQNACDIVNSVLDIPVSKKVFGSGDKFSAETEIKADGIYEFSVSYVNKATQDIVLSLTIDGKAPFSGAERLRFPGFWENENEDWKKETQNQYTPEQAVYDGALTVFARDYSGENEFPFMFSLISGKHTVDITVLQGNFVLEGMSLAVPAQTEKYSAPDKSELTLNTKPVIIEGENSMLKNSRSLIPLSDLASILVHPSDVKNRKLNYIGGSNWSQQGQTIIWNFDVAKGGYYSLGFQYRQSQAIGSSTFRALKIDGKPPFYEANRVKFDYSATWDYMIYSDEENNPYYIYLTAGSHTVSLTATIGALSKSYSLLNSATAMMGDLYVEITKVVGETVDLYRSYELFNQIPEFNSKLDEIAEKLESISSDMMKLQNNKISSSVSTVNDAINVVKKMRNNPYTAHRYRSDFYDAYTNLSALMSGMAATPLDIDRMVFSSAGNGYKQEKISLGEKIKHSFERFAITFVGSYNTLSAGNSEGEALTIWINWGRDQAETFNSILQDDFVRKSGIPVNVSLVNATLIQAIIAGKGPDCLIQMSRTEPVNLAMRGALKDLTEFDDYEEVAKRFNSDAELPYTYKNGVYALPLTQEFFVMFMRTDILNNLGIKAPETWQDFINASTILQRNNLEAVIPYTALTDSGAVNTGIGGLNLYPTFLIQNKLSIYNSAGNGSVLSDVAQTQSFVNWTNLYTKYKFQEITNFYNRFRLGSAPLGIWSYSLYTQLKTAAPEIDGRWTVALIPGTVNEDGSVNHTSAGWGSACSVTKLSKNPDKAWKFLKWWTSAEVQLKYSNMLESVLGSLGRIATANTEAFSKMDWDMQMYSVLSEQKNQTQEIPEIPGGYYTARGIDQAFWNVVETGKDATEMILKWNTVINTEVARKIKEYS